jgi:hypothetical protein
MSHFAKLNNNNEVIQVIVAEQDFINSGALGDVFQWVQTSYNSSFRKNFGGIGSIYDKSRDAFIAPQPYPSWTLNDDTCQWESPVAYPTNDFDSISNELVPLGLSEYVWNEDTLAWDPIVYE